MSGFLPTLALTISPLVGIAFIMYQEGESVRTVAKYVVEVVGAILGFTLVLIAIDEVLHFFFA